MTSSSSSLFRQADHLQLSFPENLVTPGTLMNFARSPECWDHLLTILGKIENDDIDSWRLRFYKTGLNTLGHNWDFVDNVVLAHAFAMLMKPRRVLEIGVRRGFLTAGVAGTVVEAQLVLVDPWEVEYAGRPNPGPVLVKQQLEKVSYTGKLDIYRGYSNIELPKIFTELGPEPFDLIIVDGDHTVAGANGDLNKVFSKLAVGGLLIFDDVAHPDFLHLFDLWKKWEEVIGNACQYGTYLDQGHGVAFAIRARSNESAVQQTSHVNKITNYVKNRVRDLFTSH